DQLSKKARKFRLSERQNARDGHARSTGGFEPRGPLMIRAAMRPVGVSCVIDVPRERVFDYLSDIANHAEFTDHFVKDFRIERLDSRGVGAAARFRLLLGLGSIWCEAVLTELERPYSIVAEGRAGRLGRIVVRTQYKLTPHDRGMTRVELTFSLVPAT